MDSYVGSYFTVTGLTGEPIEIVFIHPLPRLVRQAYIPFITRRFITKLTEPDNWPTIAPFSWELLTHQNEEAQFAIFTSKDVEFVTIDIETLRTNATIRCLSYSAVIKEGTSIQTVVLPIDDEYSINIMRKWNWLITAPKCLQNGKYDIAYLARYGAPLSNYLLDTAHFFHAWYSELPKDLGFLNSFFVREATYWKDLSDTNDLMEYYRYNALDTWGTSACMVAMLAEAPKWAYTNYILEFPLVPACHMCEMTGMHRDQERLEESRAEQTAIIDSHSITLDRILGVHGFNVKSPIHVKLLFKTLGCKDIQSTDEKSLNRVRFRHPFNAKFINLILGARSARTLRESYLHVGDSATEFSRPDGTGNRVLFGLHPHGTKSSRLASTEHAFWAGMNIQKIPRGDVIKRTVKADPGFYFSEVDKEQAESRYTAYLSGDEALINAVEHSPDFHSQNASAFFGVPFSDIYDTDKGEVINKALRDLAKRVNHGVNYNMGPNILVQTMGEENIIRASPVTNLT